MYGNHFFSYTLAFRSPLSNRGQPHNVQCPLWVKSRPFATTLRMSAFGGKADITIAASTGRSSLIFPGELLLRGRAWLYDSLREETFVPFPIRPQLQPVHGPPAAPGFFCRGGVFRMGSDVRFRGQSGRRRENRPRLLAGVFSAIIPRCCALSSPPCFSWSRP